MATVQYIGSRYVPIFADPVEWSSTKQYEPLTIVLHDGNSFTSKQFVPTGIDINDTAYWAETGNYNAQVEQYRSEVLAIATKNTNMNYGFESVAEMQADETLKNGDICITGGFYSENDGGCGKYIITTGTANGMDILQCQNSLVAQLVQDKECVYIKQLGCAENSVINNYFNRALEIADKICVNGTFNVGAPLVVDSPHTIFDGVLNCINTTCFDIQSSSVKIMNVHINSNVNSHEGIYAHSETNLDYTEILECHIFGFATGIHLVKCWNTIIDKCFISRNSNYGIHFEKLGVNNHITNTHITTDTNIGGEAAIYLDGSEQASEGITISDILTYRYNYAIKAIAFSHIELTNSILDYCQRAGIKLDSVSSSACIGVIVNGNYIAVDGNDTVGIYDNALTGIEESGSSPCNIYSENKILNYHISTNSIGIYISTDSFNAIITSNTFFRFNYSIKSENESTIITNNQMPLRQGTANSIYATNCIISNNRGTVHTQISRLNFGKNQLRNIDGLSIESLATALSNSSEGDFISYANGNFASPKFFKVVGNAGVKGVVDVIQPQQWGSFSRNTSDGTGDVEITFSPEFPSTPMVLLTPLSNGEISYTLKSVNRTKFVMTVHSLSANSAFYWCAFVPNTFKTS